MITEKDILFEKGDYWILRISNGLQVLKNGATHSKVVATVCYRDPAAALARAKEEIERRIALDSAKH